MEAELQRRKLEPSIRSGNVPGRPTTMTEAVVRANNIHPDEILLRIPQSKESAVMQAQYDGSKGNYKIFKSAFGNFMVPAVPNRADLTR
ncbi:hypothetical protein SAY87_029172 [Trapa incisa]|uniref:Uncharacterized protein n=1 Tax=Trapa incisa TaxID=236973 RepID=A0AAN7QSC6_9MYRT|nr:hypothetical protein SAY87_029172 [Trapa incisa]